MSYMQGLLPMSAANANSSYWSSTLFAIFLCRNPHYDVITQVLMRVATHAVWTQSCCYSVTRDAPQAATRPVWTGPKCRLCLPGNCQTTIVAPNVKPVKTNLRCICYVVCLVESEKKKEQCETPFFRPFCQCLKWVTQAGTCVASGSGPAGRGEGSETTDLPPHFSQDHLDLLWSFSIRITYVHQGYHSFQQVWNLFQMTSCMFHLVRPRVIYEVNAAKNDVRRVCLWHDKHSAAAIYRWNEFVSELGHGAKIKECDNWRNSTANILPGVCWIHFFAWHQDLPTVGAIFNPRSAFSVVCWQFVTVLHLHQAEGSTCIKYLRTGIESNVEVYLCICFIQWDNGQTPLHATTCLISKLPTQRSPIYLRNTWRHQLWPV